MTEPITLLSISGIQIPDEAARGITATLQPDTTGSLERDVNGNLVDLTLASFQKYRVTISCADWAAPVLTGIFRGSGPYDVRLIPDSGISNATDGTVTLSMTVDDWQCAPHEWDAVTDWSITLIEV